MTKEEALTLWLPVIKMGVKDMPECNEALDMSTKALEQKQEPMTGHWILQPSNKEQDERDFIWWKCSKCGQVIYSETEQDRREFHAFCGRCGAKMVEPQEGSGEE